MQFFNRSGSLILGSVAASFLFFGCESTGDKSPVEAEVAPIASEPVELVSEVPDEATLEEARQAKLREIEEKLAEQAKSKVRAPQSIEEQAERLGAEIVRIEATQQWKLSKGGRSLLVKEGSRNAELDGIKISLDTPLSRVKGKWLLAESDERNLLQALFAKPLVSQRQINTIVIDPGHGGSQDGTKNETLGILEKEMTLDVSLRLRKHLEGLGFKVALTRYDDRLVELKERSEIANGFKADLFVSVHFNSGPDLGATGLETFALTPAGYPSTSGSAPEEGAGSFAGNRFDAENLAFAFCVQKSLVERLGREDRGVKKARFAVLKGLNCPGVLAECGFVSNQVEGRLISTAGYRERVAQALMEAIVTYAGTGADPKS